MRWVTLRLGEKQELRWGLKEGSPAYNALLQPDTSLFSPRDIEVIIPELAKNYPVDSSVVKGYDDLERLGPYGPGPGTTVQEYLLPTFGWTREIAIAPGSDRVWFIETDKDRVGGLNPADGKVEWYDVPGDGPQGPHTMNSDAEGRMVDGRTVHFKVRGKDALAQLVLLEASDWPGDVRPFIAPDGSEQPGGTILAVLASEIGRAHV